MRRKQVLGWWLLALLLAAPAYASPPAKADHVDPKAPCYRWPAVDMDGDGVFDRVDNCVSTPAGCTVDQWGCSSDSDGDGVCDGVDECPNTPAGTKVTKTGCPEGYTKSVPYTPPPPPPPAPVQTPAPPPPPTAAEKGLESGLYDLDHVLFETNSAKLLPESKPMLDDVGRALQKHPDLRVEIDGHTDTTGPAAHNQQLSQARAESVRKYLIDNFGLDPGQLSAKGYGESRPLVAEKNDEDRARNRRVELKVIGKR